MLDEAADGVADVLETVGLGDRAGRNDEAIEEDLFTKIVLVGEHLHGDEKIVVLRTAGAPGVLAIPEAGEDAGHLGDLGVGVGGDRVAE